MDQEERNKLVEWTRRWGVSNSASALDSSASFFVHPEIEGFIGYRREGECTAVMGDPICQEKDFYPLANEFQKQFPEDFIVYIAASENFKELAMQENLCKASLEFGEELFFNPQEDPTLGAKGSLIRRKMRHALKEGTEVFEYKRGDEALKNEMENVGNLWLQSRKGLQIYTSHMQLFSDEYGKRWFYAKKEGSIVGILLLIEIKKKSGWFLNRVFMTPKASNGTPELLVITALETLRGEGCQFLSFGPVPKDRLGSIEGFGGLSSWLSRQVFSLGQILLHLNGKQKFWEKFQPQEEPSFLLFTQQSLSLKKIGGFFRLLNLEWK